jgi:serine/threonine-protein kinase
MTERDDSLVSISGFEILTKLSSGGMGDVLLARRRGVHGFEKLLAVKTIRGELAKRDDIRAMFLDEAKLSARIDHANIAQVYDFGEEGESLYLAMEYVPGLPLNKLLQKRGGPVPPVVAMRIMAEVLRGLHAAHELKDMDGSTMGVVHRDVSPGNLILTYDGRMKILDFGIAFVKNRESPDTVVGELKGKPSYMAPEHLRGQGVDRRADIYSASVVLHELLTGRKLFTRESVFATIHAVETLDVPKPSSIAGELPSGLDEVVLRGLEKKPQDRFQDARSMASALDKLISENDGETLESFVESELTFEREAHRQWLSNVLSGRESSDPARIEPAVRIPRSNTPLAVSPLVDSTTLVPPGGDPSQPVATIARPRSPLTWAVAAVVGFIVSFGGYRLLVGGSGEEKPAVIEARLDPAPELEEAKVEQVAMVEPQTATATKTQELVQAVEPEVQREDPKPEKKTKRTQRQNHRENRNEARESREEAADKFGFVTIGAQPYALVRIDGQEVGVTPIMRKKLPIGTHEIQLVRPDTGEIRLKRVLTLEEDEHERITLP